MEFEGASVRKSAPDSPSKELGSDTGAGGPTFMQALGKQDGLKLVKQTGSVPTFLINHVGLPSEN